MFYRLDVDVRLHLTEMVGTKGHHGILGQVVVWNVKWHPHDIILDLILDFDTDRFTSTYPSVFTQ